MLKIGIIGIAAVFFAVLLKRDRPELSMLLSVACGTIIFAFALERLGTTIEFFQRTSFKASCGTGIFWSLW